MPRFLLLLLIMGVGVVGGVSCWHWPQKAAILEIRRGGRYSGTFRSTDSAVPCVRIFTTEPVILDSCVLEGPGHLIESLVPGAHLTIRRCSGRGLAPTSDNVARGRFLNVRQPRAILVEHCRLEQTSGIYIEEWSADRTVPHPLVIRRNTVRNIDGRYRNGGSLTVGFVGLNQVRSVPGIEICWNEIINMPNQSAVEDNISLYNSSGTPAHPIRVHNNYVQGAYPYPATDSNFSGTGMTTDGDGRSALTTTAYVEAYDNQFVSTCNAAMNIAAGHHINYYRNRLVTCGLLPDGTPLRAAYAAAAVFNAYHKSPSVFFAHRIERNLIGYANPNYRVPYAGRHDLSTDNCRPCRLNEHLPPPLTLATERAEWHYWQRKLAHFTRHDSTNAAKP